MIYVLTSVAKRAALLFMPAILFLIPMNSNASHAVGGDLTYTYVGANNYQINFTLYRDCSGSPAPATLNIDVNSVSCGISTTVICTPLAGTGVEVTPVCATAQSTCSGGTVMGIQEWRYSGLINLPVACSDYVFSYSLCCRNATITNLLNPNSTKFYLYATLNNTSGQNSSPTFSNAPIPFPCAGQEFCFNHGANDANGDSLVYELITPYDTAGVPVTYLAPFNVNNPLTSLQPMQFNTATGDICITPSNLETTVIAVLVKEYRNGILIGTVERDMQFIVQNCTNSLPTVTGMNGTTDFTTTVCAGTEFCFSINTIDPDPTQNTFITWDNAISGATFDTVQAYRSSGTFCWNPQQSDASTVAHCFTVTVDDDNCPYNGSQIYSFCITVVGMEAFAGNDTFVGCNASALLHGYATGGMTGNFYYTWNQIYEQQDLSANPGKYILEVSDGATCRAFDTVQVTAIDGVPTAEFAHLDICTNAPITFSDSSFITGDAIASYLWLFGDSTTSNQQNPTHTFPGNGTYPVTLIVESSGGCRDSVTYSVHIGISFSQAEFTYSNLCLGALNSFIDISDTGNSVITNWNWDFGDGDSTSVQNASHIFTAPGNYNITLEITNAEGCTDTVQHPITIYPRPPINAGSDAILCLNDSITLGTPGNDSYLWLPSNSTQPMITVSPNVTTSYVLRVTNQFNCWVRDTVTVYVNPLPIAFAGNDTTICSLTNLPLTATGGDTYLWTPGNLTTQTINVSPTTNTTYNVTVTDNIGCSSQAQVNVSVIPAPVAYAGNDMAICQGTSVLLSASGGSSYLWTNTNQTSSVISVSPGTTTTYVVEVSNGLGCVDTASVTVNVNAQPSASFSGNLQTCQGVPVTFIDQSQIAFGSISDWIWNFGDSSNISTIQNPQHSFVNDGSYTITLTAYSDSGCTSQSTATVLVHANPVNSFSANNVCMNDAIVLTNTTTINDTTTLYYHWNFGDGNTSVNPTPAHQYNQFGDFTITLITDNVYGCADTSTMIVTVHPMPVAQFNVNNGCEESNLIFTNFSGIQQGSIANWQWDLGNGGSSNLQMPVFNYNQPDTFNIVLTLTSDSGCVTTASDQVIIYPKPVAGFTANNVCFGNPVQFNNTSAISDSSNMTYQWSFGNASNSSASNPSVNYGVSGTYSVSMIVTSNLACTDTVTDSITVYASPLASFSLQDTACSFNQLQFQNTTSIQAGNAMNWLWNFGDGDNSSDEFPSHDYDVAGNYIVQLIAYTGNQCADTTYQSIFIEPSPLVNYSVNDACLGNTVSFNDLSQGNGANLVGWQWDFGDSTTSASNNALHVYNYSGVFTTSLSVTSDNGCTASMVQTSDLEIFELPVSDFTIDTAGADQVHAVIELQNFSSAGTSLWDFGDGEYSSEYNPVHRYNGVGPYQVQLITTNIHGCLDTAYFRLEFAKANTFFVPNSFSPNGDGINDLFSPVYYNATIADAIIFDRWGIEVYSWSGTGGWDGNYKDSPAQMDAYIYKVNLLQADGSQKTYIGHVNLVR